VVCTSHNQPKQTSLIIYCTITSKATSKPKYPQTLSLQNQNTQSNHTNPRIKLTTFKQSWKNEENLENYSKTQA
jgi:hypothetical protein